MRLFSFVLRNGTDCMVWSQPLCRPGVQQCGLMYLRGPRCFTRLAHTQPLFASREINNVHGVIEVICYVSLNSYVASVISFLQTTSIISHWQRNFGYLGRCVVSTCSFDKEKVVTGTSPAMYLDSAFTQEFVVVILYNFLQIM